VYLVGAGRSATVRAVTAARNASVKNMTDFFKKKKDMTDANDASFLQCRNYELPQSWTGEVINGVYLILPSLVRNSTLSPCTWVAAGFLILVYLYACTDSNISFLKKGRDVPASARAYS
jgi:hypothetical protein